MALGGGSFISQNKVLPGAYINFVSVASATATLSDRGVVTMPLELDWGVEGQIFEVGVADFQKNSMKFFGYPYTDDRMKGLRDLFKYAQTLYAYKLNTGGTKAACTFATAKYPGVRGNALKIVIQANADDPKQFDCYTYMDTTAVDMQTVSSASDLVDNDYVVFKKDATLLVTASTPLTGGTTGTVTGTAYQDYLDKIESYRFNTMGIVTTEATVKGLAASFVKRMRDDVGVKFQLVLYDYKSADYMGGISVKNKVTDDGWSEASLVYWVTGAQAGCAVNKSLQNKQYDGEFTVDVDYNQSELTKAIQEGEFTFHNVNGDVRVLDDINTMVTTTDDCGAIFKDNQTVRVIDQIGNDIAVLFATSYLGTVPNDEAGRISLWSDIVKHHQELLAIRAIEDFEDSDVVVSAGDTKKAVVVQDAVTVVNAMGKLYMTTVVS
jgi:hypothetical protein